MSVGYREFLEQKVAFDTACGFDIDAAEVHPILLPHQRDIVVWTVHGGRRAIFARFGLGKSVMQLEVLRLVLARAGGRALIVCPLGVRQEFARDAAMLEQSIRFVRRTDEVEEPGLYVTNYESVRDGKLDPALFTAVSLDEASVLRSFGSKTYQTFLTLFGDVPYRFVAALPPEQMSRLFTEQTCREVYDYDTHIRVGEHLEGRDRLPATFMSLAPGSWHPEVWHDINRLATLNTEQSRRVQTMHVCPLQFDIVDRLIERFSNPGDLVYDPFGGLFTVPLRALKAGRRGRAVELNPGYFLDGVKYLQAEERKRDLPSLFDLDELGASA